MDFFDSVLVVVLESLRAGERLVVVIICPERMLSIPAIYQPFSHVVVLVSTLSTSTCKTLAFFCALFTRFIAKE
ncbi:hypothetical protein THOB06_310019 [Vibrio rotiferianus]|nr:hypothetical protein THOG10_310019 [Vibrio rotiferianus]CAH1584185.1 hypothetical protein THOB06_310019 [Vibrio rotiferianus]